MRTPPRGVVGKLVIAALVVTVAFITYVALTPFDGKHMREKSYRASQHYDARILMSAESTYFAGHGTYSRDTVALGYRSTIGDSVQFERADAGGWRAVVWHRSLPSGCAVGATGPTRPPAEDRSPCLGDIPRPTP